MNKIFLINYKDKGELSQKLLCVKQGSIVCVNFSFSKIFNFKTGVYESNYLKYIKNLSKTKDILFVVGVRLKIKNVKNSCLYVIKSGKVVKVLGNLFSIAYITKHCKSKFAVCIGENIYTKNLANKLKKYKLDLVIGFDDDNVCEFSEWLSNIYNKNLILLTNKDSLYEKKQNNSRFKIYKLY